jgi:hypothetical protein
VFRASPEALMPKLVTVHGGSQPRAGAICEHSGEKIFSRRAKDD